jgi:hypothetical protein
MVFEKYLNFVLKDPRTQRHFPYQVDVNFQETRHKCWFDGIELNGKSVLDLGSCVGATGAWVLDQGAEYYHGVEYFSFECDLSKENFQQYFPDKNWQITCSSVENFLSKNTLKYDVVIFGGVLHSLGTPSLICQALEHVFGFAQHCIVESSQAMLLSQTLLNTLNDSAMADSIRENESFMYFGWAESGDYENNSQMKHLSAVPSMGFIKQYSRAFGFLSNDAVYDQLKTQIPKVYPKNRYCVQLNKTGPLIPIGFADTKQHSDYTSIPWS